MLAFSRTNIERNMEALETGEMIEQSADTGSARPYDFAAFARNRVGKTDGEGDTERRTISEVLHDIYDEKAEN